MKQREMRKAFPSRYKEIGKKSAKKNGHKYVAKQRIAQKRWRVENKERISALRSAAYALRVSLGIKVPRKTPSDAFKSKHAEQERMRRFKKRSGSLVSVQEWTSIRDSYLGMCVYCNSATGVTVDHVIPLAGGGEHSTNNIVPCCVSCNSSKRDTPLVLWLARRRRYKQLLENVS